MGDIGPRLYRDRSAGIHVIGFGGDPALAEADAVIQRMDKLPAALKRLSTAN